MPVTFDEARDENRELSIHFYKTRVTFERWMKGNRSAGEYPVNLSAVAKCFGDTRFSTPLLPPGCLFVKGEGAGLQLGLYCPPQRRELYFQYGARQKRVAITAPLPGLILVGRGSHYSIFAVKEYPQLDTALFRAPLSNVDHRGEICVGTADMGHCQLNRVSQIWDGFWKSAGTHDTDPPVVSDIATANLFTFYSKLRSRRFPIGCLVPLDACVKDLLKGD